MPLTPRNIEWIAGFLEGEGAFGLSGPNRKSALVAAAQVQMEPLERLMRMVGGNLHTHTSKKPNHQVQGRWSLSGINAAGLMMTVYPLMSPRRKEQIRAALSVWRSALPHTKYRSVCKRGHPLEGPNLVVYPPGGRTRPGRMCRACSRITARATYYRISEGLVKRRYITRAVSDAN